MPATTRIEISISEELFPRYDAAHGTPDPMIRRLATFKLPTGEATFEQTDYGHPGRFNNWEQRGLTSKLQPQEPALRAICASLEALLT
jgi:hypothetical protein